MDRERGGPFFVPLYSFSHIHEARVQGGGAMSPEADVPAACRRLLPGIAGHLEGLARSFDLIGEDHRAAGRKLVDWIVDHYRPGQPLPIIVVCTGNSRRSILGATMGNLAAASCGLPEVRFHSGGTDPTAFNPRTIAALRAIGVQVEPMGQEAARG